MSPPAVLEALGIEKSFPVRRRRRLRAVDGVDLRVEKGECLALVGESGCGKTTLAKCLIRLLEPDAGRVFFGGEDLLALKPRELRAYRRRFQMVFQGNALNPRFRVERLIAEPLLVHRMLPRTDVPQKVRALLSQVGLADALASRYPHQLSGGQRQRVGIARALATDPELLILDEPVSALDVSVRAQILRLLHRLRQDLALTMVFISHDLAVVEQLADRVAVLYLGQVVESGRSEEIFSRQRHPYTASLLASVPIPDPERRDRQLPLVGEIPSPLNPPSGCRFHTRCPVAQEAGPAKARCQEQIPKPVEELVDNRYGHVVSCHFPRRYDGVPNP